MIDDAATPTPSGDTAVPADVAAVDAADAVDANDDAAIVRRIREAGRLGGLTSAANKRERRRRYLNGEMGRVEKAEYERWVERNRAAGRKGGWPSHKRNRALVEAARRADDDENAGSVDDATNTKSNGHAPLPKPKHVTT